MANRLLDALNLLAGVILSVSLFLPAVLRAGKRKHHRKAVPYRWMAATALSELQGQEGTAPEVRAGPLTPPSLLFSLLFSLWKEFPSLISVAPLSPSLPYPLLCLCRLFSVSVGALCSLSLSLSPLAAPCSFPMPLPSAL